MLQPRKTKYRRQFRGKRRGMSATNTDVNFGTYGLKAIEAGWVSARQIESARRAMTHYTKRGGRIWIRIFPSKPVSKKPPEVRMGGGKGDTNEWVAVVRPGLILFEMGAVTQEVAQEAMRLAQHKLSVSTRFVTKGEM